MKILSTAAAAALLLCCTVVACQDGLIPVAPEDGPHATQAEAATVNCNKKQNRDLPECNGGGGGTESQLGFDLTINTATTAGAPTGVRGDGSPDYSDGSQKVMVATGGGPGFRFDTNGSQKVEHPNDQRHVSIDLDGDGTQEILSGVDFRFDRGLGGLDLCSMNPGGASETVPAVMRFEDGGTKALSWGCREAHDSQTLLGPPLAVTRLADVDGRRQWRMDGTTACLRSGDGFGPLLDPSLDVPVSFTITEQ